MLQIILNASVGIVLGVILLLSAFYLAQKKDERAKKKHNIKRWRGL